jgi:hypothetical protein
MSCAVELLRGFVAVPIHAEYGNWRQYKNFFGERWWSKAGTDMFFYESDPAWRTAVNANGKFWHRVDSWRANILQDVYVTPRARPSC